jgi:ferritin-like metal-binding protein YciE
MANELQQRVTDMVALERQVEEALGQWAQEVQEYAEAGTTLRHIQTKAKGQREALQERLQAIGGAEPSSADSSPTFGVPTGAPSGQGSRTVSVALHAAYAALHYAAFGYAMLHTTAHRFNEGSGAGEGNTADMAEEHRASYVEASQAIHRLINDMVIWEMGKDGECVCTCPSCSLGICLCWHAHVDSLMPVSPAEEGGVLVRQPKANSAALQADLRQGDVILAADDQPVQTYPELQAEVRKREPGDEIRLRVKRGPGEPLEITVTLPG